MTEKEEEKKKKKMCRERNKGSKRGKKIWENNTSRGLSQERKRVSFKIWNKDEYFNINTKIFKVRKI